MCFVMSPAAFIRVQTMPRPFCQQYHRRTQDIIWATMFDTAAVNQDDTMAFRVACVKRHSTAGGCSMAVMIFKVPVVHAMEADQMQPRTGTTPARRCMSSSGDITIWVVPSR
jgi:hypothetical protein